MRITINGHIIRYSRSFDYYPDYDGIEDDRYYEYEESYIKTSNGWVQVHLMYFIKSNVKTLRIWSSHWKDEEDTQHVVKKDDYEYYKTFYLSDYKYFLFEVYDYLFKVKLRITKKLIEYKQIKKNVLLILLALLVSTTYYLINHYFDGFLQKLINESNFVQSLIVFLSISSLINIFHPFTLRKEINMDDIRSKVKKSIIKAEKEAEHRKKMKDIF